MKIAVIGVGNMAQALINGFIRKGAHLPGEIFIYDIDKEKASEIAGKSECIFCQTPKEAVENCEIVLLAVKPNVISDCIKSIKDSVDSDKLVISIAAGISISNLREMLDDENVGLVRVMPNTPSMISEGVSAMSFDKVSGEKAKYAMELFSSCGTVLRIEEEKMDAVTGLSGGGPAYVMMFIEALTDAGVKAGLTRREASVLACGTVKGSASMVIETDMHPAGLKDNVCSPGGTTIAGVHALEKGGFRAAVIDGVTAAVKRSKEISGK